MKITRGRGQAPQQRAVVHEAPGNEVNDFAIALEHAFHTHQLRAEQFAALAFAQIVPDHDVDIAGFVLEGDKYHAGCGIRSLSAGDDAGGARAPAMRQGPDFAGGGKAQACEPRTQQREGVTPERETQAGVIGDQILAFGRCGKCRP